MSGFAVTVEKLTIHPHPNADRLELAQVGLYRAVVGKGQYQTGDYAIYIPEQAVLPDALIEELDLVGRLAGKNKNRVKAVRLRGELSQGLVCRPKAVAEYSNMIGDDFAGDLGITKWVPEIPTCMNGVVEPAPALMRWVDIQNLQRYPDIFEPDEPVIATEKIHGTCLLATYDLESQQLFVSSKGHGEKNLSLVESEGNLYWRAARKFKLREILGELCKGLDAVKVAVYGEVFGQGVQDLYYGYDVRQSTGENIGFRAFDFRVDLGFADGTAWVDADLFRVLCAACRIPAVPVLYEGPFNLVLLTEVASGPSTLEGAQNIREGVVIRPARERHSEVLGGRAIAKLVSPDYLLRKGEATEFE